MTTSQKITNHLLKDGVEWQPLKEYFLDKRQSCVDGRDDKAVIGTPGGDMGILLLMIMAAEKVLNREFNKSEVKEIFARYVNEFGVFYYHSDQHSVHHLAEELKHESCFSRYLDGDFSESELIDIMGRLLQKPINSQQRAVLLEYVINVDSIGCGHLKLASKFAKEYEIRLEALQILIRAFFQESWHWGKTDFVVLEGGHAEQLILNVHLDPDAELFEETLVPAVRPQNPKTSSKQEVEEFFVNHPEIVSAIHRHNAIVMVNKQIIPGLTPLRLESFLSEVKKLGNKQLKSTLRHLAPNLEIWNAVLKKSEEKTKILSVTKA